MGGHEHACEKCLSWHGLQTTKPETQSALKLNLGHQNAQPNACKHIQRDRRMRERTKVHHRICVGTNTMMIDRKITAVLRCLLLFVIHQLSAAPSSSQAPFTTRSHAPRCSATNSPNIDLSHTDRGVHEHRLSPPDLEVLQPRSS